jgi:hypothetical protein
MGEGEPKTNLIGPQINNLRASDCLFGLFLLFTIMIAPRLAHDVFAKIVKLLPTVTCKGTAFCRSLAYVIETATAIVTTKSI